MDMQAEEERATRDEEKKVFDVMRVHTRPDEDRNVGRTKEDGGKRERE